MTTPKHPRRTVSPRAARSLRALIAGLALVCGLAAPAGAATGGRVRSSDVTQIEPIARFDESEVRTLVEKPSVTFSVDNPRIASGGEAKLSWRVENADSVSISGVGGVGSSGTRTVKPTQRTTYTLTAVNRNGTVSKSVTVDITTLAVITDVKILTPVVLFENIAYNFVDGASKAKWGSTVPLSFGAGSGTKGWARVINSVRAEDNKDYSKVLQVSPERKADGFIYGEYIVGVPPNAKFLATVGFTRSHGTPDGATVSVQVRGPARPGLPRPSWKQILTKTISTDGKLDTIEVDLKAWANQKVLIRLVVNARSNGTDDIVLWIAPRIIK